MIDSKLKGLNLEFLHGVPVHLSDDMVEQVKQVFLDAGYRQISLKKLAAIEKHMNYHPTIDPLDAIYAKPNPDAWMQYGLE